MRQMIVGIILVYIFFSLRFLYKQAWWKTILKSLIVTFVLVATTMIVIMVLTLVDAMVFQ